MLPLPFPQCATMRAIILRRSDCVELAGAWGGTPDVVYSGRCVCTLADVHPTSAEGSGRAACSVSSAGIRCVKQCLEAVLVAFEAAGDTHVICYCDLFSYLMSLGCARSVQQAPPPPPRASSCPCMSCPQPPPLALIHFHSPGPVHPKASRSLVPHSVRAPPIMFCHASLCQPWPQPPQHVDTFCFRSVASSSPAVDLCYAGCSACTVLSCMLAPCVMWRIPFTGCFCCWSVRSSSTPSLEVAASKTV